MSESFNLDSIKRSVLAQNQQPSKLLEIVDLCVSLQKTEEAIDLLLESLTCSFELDLILEQLRKLIQGQGNRFWMVSRSGPNLENVFETCQPGDLVFLESGLYEGPFVLKQPITLIGVPESETILYSYTETPLEIRNCNGGHIFGIQFEYKGTLKNTVACWIIQSSPRVSHCQFTSKGLTGCEVKGKKSSPSFFQNTFAQSLACGMNILDGACGVYTKNSFRHNGMHGLSIKGQGTNPHLFQNCFEENSQLGIHILEQASGKIYQNYFLRNKLHGIEIKEEATPEIYQNYLKANEELGIHIMDRGRAKCYRNRLIHNGLHGIEVKGFGSWAELRENYCGMNSESGILFQDHASGLIHKNQIVKNALNGIEIRGQKTTPQVAENVVYGNRGRGIFVYQEAKPFVTRNIVMKNHTGISGIEVDNYPKIGMPQLKNNCVFGNKENYERVTKGEGDICEDPQFIEPDKGDFRLNESSPVQKLPPLSTEEYSSS